MRLARRRHQHRAPRIGPPRSPHPRRRPEALFCRSGSKSLTRRCPWLLYGSAASQMVFPGDEDGQKEPDSPSKRTQSQTQSKAPAAASAGERLRRKSERWGVFGAVFPRHRTAVQGNIGTMKGRESTALIFVLAGLVPVPAIHALSGRDKDVGARIKSAQDDSKSLPARPTQVHLARKSPRTARPHHSGITSKVSIFWLSRTTRRPMKRQCWLVTSMRSR